MPPLRSDTRSYVRVSLDSDPLLEEDQETRLLRRIMVELPRPAHERSMFTRTPNGNLVPRVAR